MHGTIECLLIGNEGVNTHPKQKKTVFSMGSVQRSYLEDSLPYESVSSLYETATEIS
jgi:hypothetical protein